MSVILFNLYVNTCKCNITRAIKVVKWQEIALRFGIVPD